MRSLIKTLGLVFSKRNFLFVVTENDAFFVQKNFPHRFFFVFLLKYRLRRIREKVFFQPESCHPRFVARFSRGVFLVISFDLLCTRPAGEIRTHALTLACIRDSFPFSHSPLGQLEKRRSRVKGRQNLVFGLSKVEALMGNARFQPRGRAPTPRRLTQSDV